MPSQTCPAELSFLDPHWPMQATVRSERHLVVPGAPGDSSQMRPEVSVGRFR